MSRMKDLITDVTFELQSMVLKDVPAGRKMKTEEVYTYLDKENGSQVCFHAHPTKAWNWVIVPEGTNELGKIVASAVIEAFCKAGLKQGKNQKFEDLIKTLKL